MTNDLAKAQEKLKALGIEINKGVTNVLEQVYYAGQCDSLENLQRNGLPDLMTEAAEVTSDQAEARIHLPDELYGVRSLFSDLIHKAQAKAGR